MTQDLKQSTRVLDNKGEPLVLYHGSTHAIAKFNTEGEGDEVGAFFTTNPASLDDYVEGAGGNISPVYLHITQPYEVSVEEWSEGEGLSPLEARTETATSSEVRPGWW